MEADLLKNAKPEAYLFSFQPHVEWSGPAAQTLRQQQCLNGAVLGVKLLNSRAKEALKTLRTFARTRLFTDLNTSQKMEVTGSEGE